MHFRIHDIYIHIPYSYYSNINLFLLFSLCDSENICCLLNLCSFLFYFCFGVCSRKPKRNKTKQFLNSLVSCVRITFHFLLFFFLVRVLNFSVLRLSFRAREGIFVRIAKLHAHTSKSHAKMWLAVSWRNVGQKRKIAQNKKLLLNCSIPFW